MSRRMARSGKVKTSDRTKVGIVGGTYIEHNVWKMKGRERSSREAAAKIYLKCGKCRSQSCSSDVDH